jgi:type IV secretory pathway VirB10-like protein
LTATRLKISPFGVLIKKVRIADYRAHLLKKEEEAYIMQFVKKTPSYKPGSHFQPVLPLVPIELAKADKDKSKYITFELKVRAGAAAAPGTTYKMSVSKFEQGTPQEWMDTMTKMREIWRQNTVNGPHDRAATVAAILQGDSLTSFETALEDLRIDPDPNNQVPVVLTIEHVETALRAVTTVVFPFRALEVQKQWMLRSMKKPYDLSTRNTASALSKLNNYLPHFPTATIASKFSESELIGLLEWSLPHNWRKQMDLRGFIPSLGTKEELIAHCERIERNEIPGNEREKHNNNNNKKEKKSKFAKFENNKKKDDGENVPTKDSFYCSKCGKNPTHNTDRCYILKNLARKQEQANGDGKAHAKPFSKRSFRKEINAMARKAGKNDGLAVIASALKREQGKHAKRSSKKHTAAAAKKKTESSESDSDSDESVHILEKPIPRKSVFKAARKAQKKKDIFADLMEAESTDEDANMAEDNQPTAEEKAFFDLISKEESEEKKKSSKETCASNDEETD